MEHSDDEEDLPTQTGPVENLDPEGLKAWSRGQLECLQANIDAMEREIAAREFRCMVRSWHSGALVPETDPDLPLMRSRLATRRAALAALLNDSVLPEGLGDPGLEPETPEDPAVRAVQALITAAARVRRYPVEDPLVSEEEVEEEHERQLGERQPGSGPARRGRVRAR